MRTPPGNRCRGRQHHIGKSIRRHHKQRGDLDLERAARLERYFEEIGCFYITTVT
jgi:hypothetical protein